jgi:hypothetical protein
MASTISSLIIDNVKKLIDQMLPPIIQTVIDTGIENIGESNMKMPDVCLPQNELQNILNLRNNLKNKVNNVYKTVKSLSKITDVLQPAIDTTKTSLDIAKIAVNTVSAAMLAIPPAIPIPSQLITGLVNVNTLVNVTLPPILNTNINKLESITISTDFANNTLLKLNNLLSAIDQYLLKCGIDPNNLTPLDDGLKKLEQSLNEANVSLNNTNQVYKGFVLAIVEEPYSPTVKRRKAEARNTQGIALLSTPLTFSTNTQVLIEELKLMIDSNNLKAD